MLKIDLIEDEVLRGAVNDFISGLLPHENFDASAFSSVLDVLLKYIHPEEFRMEHRLLVEALVDLRRIKMSMPDFEPRLEKETFTAILESSISDAIVRPELGVSEWLVYEGMSSNLAVQTNKEDACQKVCERALELYEECYNLAIDSNVVLNKELELKSAFIQHMGVQCINSQSEIMRHELRVGRKRYSGFTDWFKYTKGMLTELDERLTNADQEKVLHLDSPESSYSLLRQLSELLVPIANYGIPEIDAYTPILRHRLVVVVGRENIGKTKFAIDQVVNVIRAGGRGVYMCGESEKAKVFASIIINFVWKEYGIIIRPEHLTAPEMCPDDVRKIIGMSVDRIVNQGGLTLCDSFNYGTLKQELTAIYEKSKFDIVVIDHSCALVGTVGDGSLNAKISQLAVDCREFKKANPVCVMVTSHPSTDAKDSVKKDKRIMDSATRGSSVLSSEADEVFTLRDNETLIKQDLVMLENGKRRDAGVITTPIILKKRFDVSSFEYDPSLQSGESKMSLEREAALDELDKQLGMDEDVSMYNLE